jgi:hypothetical protein
MSASGAGSISFTGGESVLNDVDGLMEATGSHSVLSLGTNAGTTNFGKLDAFNGATVVVDAQVNNAGGTIGAYGSGSTVQLDGSTIHGGTLQSDNGGAIEIVSGAGSSETLNGSDVNGQPNPMNIDGYVKVDAGGNLALAGTVHLDENATIELLDGATNDAHPVTSLVIEGYVTLQNLGTVELDGTNLGGGQQSAHIGGDANNASNVLDSTALIEGTGIIGDSNMSLINENGGTIETWGYLALDTGANTIFNYGTLIATGDDAQLVIRSAVDNGAKVLPLISVEAESGGTVEFTHDVSGGVAMITGGGTVEYDAGSSVYTDFNGNGTLIIQHIDQFTGQIAGLSGSNDFIDVGNQGTQQGDAFEVLSTYDGTTTSLQITDTNPNVNDQFTLHLLGDYTSAVWSVSSDNSGGVLIHDPPAADSTALAVDSSASAEGAGGSVVFADQNPADTMSANFTAEGADYFGNFALNQVNASGGEASVSWEFDFSNQQVSLAPGQTATQSYEVALTDVQNPAANQTQTVSVTVGGPGNDNFVFAPGVGADTVLNFNSQQDTVELDHFANAQTVQELQSLITADTHGNAVLDLGNHDSITFLNTTQAQLQQAVQSGHVLLH